MLMGKYHRIRRGGNQANKSKRRLNEVPTPAEAAFAKQLTAMQIKYVQNHIIRTANSLSGYYLVDFWIPSKKLIIELDGQPHVGQAAKWKDLLRTQDILEVMPDVRIVRIWNHIVLADPKQAAIDALSSRDVY